MEKSIVHRKISLSHFFLFVVFIFCTIFVRGEEKEMKKRCDCRQDCNSIIGTIGSVIDERSRVGKEQKIAIQMAIEDYTHQWSSCSKLALYIRDSYGNSARAAFTVIDLVKKEKVQAIITSSTMQEVALLTQFEEVKNADTPIITIGSAVISPSPLFHQPPSIFEMNGDIYTRMRCVAEIIGHFRWQRVTVIYEQGNSFYSDSTLKSQLSKSLKPFDSFVESDMAFPSLSSLQEPQAFIQENLKKLKRKNSRIFVLLQSSIEFATILFENAKKMELMEKGYAWILCDDVVNLLDSLEPSSRRNMEGIIGFRTANIVDKRKSFRQFKSRFRLKYRSAYPEEEHPNPSMYALRAYDATTIIAKSMQASERNMNSSKLINHISATNFDGLSGKITFNNGKLLKNTTFQIINVIGRQYRPISFWSQEHGFSRNFTHCTRKGSEEIGNDNPKEFASIYWPGGEQTTPNGSVLRIGVPAMATFHQFVHIEYDQVQKPIFFGGFALEVFDAAVKMLPYHLPYVFIPFNGTYDEMVVAVSNKTLDAAVGDTIILEHRYQLVDFTLPYLDSQIVMVAPEQKDLKGQRFVILEAFEWELWVVLAALSHCTAAIIYFNERMNGNSEFVHPFPEMIGSIVWLSITLLSFAQRQAVKSSLSRLVLVVWLCVIVVVTASYTAVLSTMMTVPRLKPVIVDIDYLKRTNATIGCNGKSFIVKYLQQTLKFNEENIQRIDSYKDYRKAFATKQIAAAFLISPHAKVFIAKNRRFVMAKPSFEVGGLSFVLPKASPLTKDISKAILNMKENGVINQMEQLILSSPALSSSSDPDDKLSLSLEQFSGLLMVSSAIDTIVLCIIIIRLIGGGGQFRGYTYPWLAQRRFWTWASFLLAKSHVGLGSRFFRTHIVHRQNNQMIIV